MKCACLVLRDKEKLLLVRVRDNKVWYLPGGKIENNETPEYALVREISEELGVDIAIEDLEYLTTVHGDNHDRTGKVTLICFILKKMIKNFIPCCEVSEVKWIAEDENNIAPAVVKLIRILQDDI